MTPFEYAAATVRDPSPYPGEEAEQNHIEEVAEYFQYAMIRLVESCGFSPVRLTVAVCRMGGMSYQEIGAKFKMSRQGIHKHILAVAKKNPMLSHELKCKFAINESISGNHDVIKLERDIEEQIRRFDNGRGLPRQK